MPAEAIVAALMVFLSMVVIFGIPAIKEMHKIKLDHKLALLKVRDEIDGRIHQRYLETEKAAQAALEGSREPSEAELAIEKIRAETALANARAEEARERSDAVREEAEYEARYR